MESKGSAIWSMPKIRASTDSGFGGKALKYQDYERVLAAPIPDHAPWFVIQDMAMSMIENAEDQHHVYIEQIRLCSEDPNTVWIETGS